MLQKNIKTFKNIKIKNKFLVEKLKQKRFSQLRYSSATLKIVMGL